MERHGRRSPGAGFSLLEVVLVVAIVAVLAAIAAPHYGRAAARYRADVAARRIIADLEYARITARTAGASRTVTFSPGANEYTITGLAGMDGRTAYRVALGDAPYDAEILKVDLGGDAAVVFDGYGAADSGGTVLVRVGEATRTLVLDADSGKATLP